MNFGRATTHCVALSTLRLPQAAIHLFRVFANFSCHFLAEGLEAADVSCTLAMAASLLLNLIVVSDANSYEPSSALSVASFRHASGSVSSHVSVNSAMSKSGLPCLASSSVLPTKTTVLARSRHDHGPLASCSSLERCLSTALVKSSG